MKNMYKKSEDASKEAAKRKDDALSATLEKSAKNMSSRKARKFEEPEIESNIPKKRVKVDEENNEEEISEKPKKKKKKKQRESSPQVDEEVQEEVVEKKVKKKKNKKQKEEEMVEEVKSELEEVS